jgi:hypothetical protein
MPEDGRVGCDKSLLAAGRRLGRCRSRLPGVQFHQGALHSTQNTVRGVGLVEQKE